MAKAERRARKPPPASPRFPAEITLAIAAAQDKKVLDLAVLDLRKGSAFTDFFLIGTGANVRQVQAIADAIEDALRRKGVRPALVEGYSRGEWVLLDYFDFIVHVFLPATRDFYGLERLWGDAERIEISA
jgi:ribosome-associated protein